MSTSDLAAVFTRADLAYTAIGEADPNADRLPDVVVRHFTDDMRFLAGEFRRMADQIDGMQHLLDARQREALAVYQAGGTR